VPAGFATAGAARAALTVRSNAAPFGMVTERPPTSWPAEFWTLMVPPVVTAEVTTATAGAARAALTVRSNDNPQQPY
jgi:hypothetical protein